MNPLMINPIKSYTSAHQAPLQKKKEERNYYTQTPQQDGIKPIHFTGSWIFFPEKNNNIKETATPNNLQISDFFKSDNQISASLEKFFGKNLKIVKNAEITVHNNVTNSNENLYLFKVNYETRKNGIVVITKEGKIAGHIRRLDYEECSDENKYLRLKHFKSPMKNIYRGIGTAIIQASIEDSLEKGFEGQLRVDATAYEGSPSPFPFYLKTGFKFENPEISIDFYKKKYDSIKNIAIPFEKYLAEQCEYMFLDKEAVEKIWLPKIKANPIFKS